MSEGSSAVTLAYIQHIVRTCMGHFCSHPVQSLSVEINHSLQVKRICTLQPWSPHVEFQIHLHPERGPWWDCCCNPHCFAAVRQVKAVLCLAKGHPSALLCLPFPTRAFQLSRFTWGSTQQVPQWLLLKLISRVITWSFSPMPNCIFQKMKLFSIILFHAALHHSTEGPFELTSNILTATSWQLGKFETQPLTMPLCWGMKWNESALCWLHTGSGLSGRSLGFHCLAGA